MRSAREAAAVPLPDVVVGMGLVVLVPCLGNDGAMGERPVGECFDQVGQAGPGLGQAVVDLGRDGRVHGAQDESIAFQPAHGEGEHALGDTVDRALQFAEAARLAGELDDHEYRQLVADAVQDIADPAVRVIFVPAGIEVGGWGG